ncbi:MAG TPA: UvrD-helicase domain-containing protein, partial [Nitrospira sp.]|nr:UvrD-helicase domain-containing protein [Nitrospira sp.]
GAREAAETTFDRNVVVVAGAGTGKTTLLVNRLVHLLMKEPRPIAITEIVALTFTNKAATEMKVRLREQLGLLVDLQADATGRHSGGAVSLRDLQARYGLTRVEITARAGAALKDMEKAQIGTLHSFAGHLLRLHPLACGVDPDFREDDGLRFEEHFSRCWDVWIDRELSREGTHHAFWRTLLQGAGIEQVRALTQALCSELVDLSAFSTQLEGTRRGSAQVQWLSEIGTLAQALLDRYDRPRRRKIEEMLRATVVLTTLLGKQGIGALDEVPAVNRQWLEKELDSKPAQGWEKTDYHEAVLLIGIAQQCLAVDHAFFINLLRIITPLASAIRSSFAAQGWLSFDGLLARARRLLHDHSAIRERIKRDYRAVLVDEFQDTDPVQYEIILAVSEKVGCHASAWQDIALEPGKLFIVGDPKQSIYAFRRADIEAFDRVIDKIVADRGAVHTLTTNFRSDAAVLGPINEVFDRLFVRRPLVQPANVRLEVCPGRHQSGLAPGVQLLVTTASEAEEMFDADEAARAEGEALARWLKDEVLSRPNCSAGQIALLFRKLTRAEAYLDALRRHDIPYVIEGEKHFYRRQEIIDLVNVLRVLDHPHDRIALTGILRSPLGGLTDRELVEFQEAGLLDYLSEPGLKTSDHPRASAVDRLYRQLARLHREAPAFPLADVIQLVFDRLPLLELAAASLHGEQAVANLLKVKQMAGSLSDRAHLTLSAFVELMVERLDEQPEEAESPLAEESSDAVHILTIHKAKGLEFPVVVLPGLHQGSGRRDRSVPQVIYDWSSGTYGLTLGERRTIGAVLAQGKFGLREEAEQRRILYVGMTRARDLLILSGGVVARSQGETPLDWLQEIGQGSVGEASTRQLHVGASTIAHRVIQAPDRKWPKRSLTPVIGASAPDPSSFVSLWREREGRWMGVRAVVWHLTPTALARDDDPLPPHSADAGYEREIGRLVGMTAHRILQQWDFSVAPSGLSDQIGPALRAVLGPDEVSFAPVVAESLQHLFAVFGDSDIYARLHSVKILGREVPFLMPWGEQQVMQGMIDLVYRTGDTIWIADYKTDAVTATRAKERAEQYRTQAEIYKTAVRHTLDSEDVRFQCLFLRCGTAIEL